MTQELAPAPFATFDDPLGQGRPPVAKNFIDAVAIVCHEANRAFSAAFLDERDHKPWADTPEELRDSSRHGVRLFLDNPLITPRGMHEAWMLDKAAAGWELGSVKDAEAKTHPCMVPYDALPEGQRVKDELFCAIVRGLTVMNDEPTEV